MFLGEYLSRRHSILIELLRHESFPSNSICSHCQQSTSAYVSGLLWIGHLVQWLLCFHSCASSIPRVEMWNGTFFQRSDLLTHQLTINLCHDLNDCPPFPQLSGHKGYLTQIFPTRPMRPYELSDGYLVEWPSAILRCSIRRPMQEKKSIETNNRIVHRNLQALDVDGVNCAKSVDQYVQLLLCAKLFPASFKKP